MTPSHQTLSGLPAEGHTLYTEALEYLVEIDEGIDRLDKILARLQPPINGRVRVSWRKEGERALTQCKPVLVRWKKQGEFWRSAKLGLKNLVQKSPKTGAFYDTREEIREAVRELALLLNRRSDVVASIQRLEKSIRFSRERNTGSMQDSKEKIEALYRRAEMIPCKWKDGRFEQAPQPIDLANMEVMDLSAMSSQERTAFIESLGQK